MDITMLDPLVYLMSFACICSLTFANVTLTQVVQRHSAVYNKTVVQAAQKVVQNGKTIYLHEDPAATIHMVVGTAGAMFTENALDPPPAWNELFFYEYELNTYFGSLEPTP